MSERGEASSKTRRAAVERLFEHSRPQIARLEALNTRMSAAAMQCGQLLQELTSLEMTGELIDIQQVKLGEGLAQFRGTVRVTFVVHAWRSVIVVCFSPGLLFRMLDAMFGGDGSARAPTVPRELKQIESRIATRAGASVLDALRESLADVAPISATLDHVRWAEDIPSLTEAEDDAVVVGIRIAEFGEQILATLPVQMLEDARGKLQTKEPGLELELDPTWRRTFEGNVLTSEVELIAVAPGPAMRLGDVAELRPGSLVELDSDALQKIRITCSDEAVFEGRLGQSKGFFTICLETPLARNTRDAPQKMNSRR